MEKDQQALKSVIKGAAISTTGVFVSQYVLSPVIGILNTRILGVETYGLFALASSVIGLFAMIPLLGMHEGILKFVPVYLVRNQIEKVKGALFYSIRLTTVVAVICCIGCVAISHYLAVYFFRKPELELILYLAAVTIILNTYQYLFAGFFAALKDIKIRTLIKYIYPNVSKLIILIFVYLVGGGIIGVMGAVLAASWIQAIAGWIHAKKMFPALVDKTAPAVFNPEDKKEFLQYSTPLYLVLFVDIILQQTDGVMIGYFCSAAEVGIYEVSFRFTPFLLLALGSTAQMFQPIISEYFAKNESFKVSSLYKQVTYIIITVTIPIGLSFILFAEELLSLFGKQFSTGSNVLRVLTIGFLIRLSFGHTGAILALSGKPRVIFYNNSLITILNIILNYWMIQRWGFIGAAISTSLSLVLSELFLWIILFRYYQIYPFTIRLWKPLSAGVVTGVIMIYIRQLLLAQNLYYLILLLFVGVIFIIYFFVLYILRLSPEEKNLLIDIKNKFIAKTGVKL